MEESKAAAYYDELTRKGEGAAKFKQGLGFSDNTAAVPLKGSALPSSSSFLSSFVKSSSTNTESDIQHQSELHSIKNKLKKKAFTSDCYKPRVSDRRDNESNARDRDRDRVKRSTRRSRSREHKSRYRSSSRDEERSRSRSRSRERRYLYRSSSRDGERRRRKSRSLSPPRERRKEGNAGGGERDKGGSKGVEKNGGKIDYALLIDGYNKMSPAERVKAKMKLQLTETAEKDVTNGTGSGWERFEFNKDAPLDDEEIEAAEDDAKIVKHIGQSFRFSAVEARKEEKIKAAHDNAMFGAPIAQISATIDVKVDEENNKTENEKTDVTSLASEKVLAKQQGSWRDRVRKT